MQLDFFLQFIAWTIMITAAGSFYDQGITNIETAYQAAHALETIVRTLPNSDTLQK